MIETALYSFWSTPYLEKNAFKTFAEFNTEYDFVLSWSMSVKLAKQNFKKVVFVTDTWAWENLFKKLNLPFDEVKLSLDDITHTTDVWSVSKAYAILEMDAPFLHIDSDVYLWTELPNHILNKPILVQDAESILQDRTVGQVYLALEWEYNTYLKSTSSYLDNSNFINRDVFGYNCGVVGGNDVKFLNKWASEMIKVTSAYDEFKKTSKYNNHYIAVWVEQSLLLVMSDFYKVQVTELIDRNQPQNFYTHLMGSSKRDVEMMKLLDKKHEKLFGKFNYKKTKKYFDISKIFRIFGYNKK
jgi:hypothetical protein